MEKRELLETLSGKRIYATDEPMLRWVEYTGEFAEIRNAMHGFLMHGLDSEDVSVNFIEKTSPTEHLAVKVWEMPMTLTVVHGGDAPAYAYYKNGVPVVRNEVLGDGVIEEALLNMEDTGRYVWDIFSQYFAAHNISLGQIDLTFGHLAEHFIVLCGDLTPDTMHLFDPDTGKRLHDGSEDYDLILQRMSQHGDE